MQLQERKGPVLLSAREVSVLGHAKTPRRHAAFFSCYATDTAMKEYCVKRTSQTKWELILKAEDTKDAARKFVHSIPCALSDEIRVAENVASGWEEAVYWASDLMTGTNGLPAPTPLGTPIGDDRPALWANPWSLLVLIPLLVAVFVGSFHIITGEKAGLHFVRRDSFSFSEFFIDADAITRMPWLAAKSRFPIGCRVLQREGLIEGNGLPKDSTAAVKWYRMAAELGYAPAQFKLGWMYAAGDGVAKDSAEAARWYRKAAEKGDAAAENQLGLMYTNGVGVGKDSTEAVKWYRKAAEQGYAPAQFNLGFMYAFGWGIAREPTETVKWFRKAAEQGYAEAQFNLGYMYATGHGVPKDSTEAEKWFRKAAEQGYAQAQFNLGTLYANGDGVPKDETEALAWYYIAAASGNDHAVMKRDTLERRLGQAMALLAQQRSREILKEIEANKAKAAASK